jgi:membrane protease YdiL (CAAX protease family)
VTEPLDNPSAVPQARPVAVPYAVDVSGTEPDDIHSLPFALPPEKTFSRWAALFDLVIVGGLTFAIMVIVQVGAMLAEQQGLIADLKEAVPVITVAMGLVTMCVVFAVVTLRKEPFESIGWTSANLGMNLMVGFALWASIMIVSIMFLMVLGMIWPAAFEDFTQARTRIEGVFPRISIPSILLMSLVISFYEEVLFRGLLLARLRQIFRSPAAAVIASSLLFGSMHIYEGYAAVIMITIFGLILAVCTLWRKSLVAAIVAHFLFNSFQLIMLHTISDTWE